MAAEVDKLQVKIEANAQSALKAVDYLISKLGDLHRVSVKTISSLNSISSSLGQMKNSFASAKVVNPFSGVQKGAEKTAESTDEAKKEISATANAVKKLDAHSSSAGRSISKTSNHLHLLSKAAHATVGRLTGFLKSIMRIAKYRAIRAALRAITSALKTGTENLYAWSQAYNTSFAPTMDKLSTSMLYLKNGFAAMFSPLIEYFAPFIDQLVDKLVNAFNWVQKLFAQLTGRKTWNKAVKVQTTYKEATQDTVDSVKELRQELQLMDFDELNNITENQDNGKAAKAADVVNPDPTKMFTLEKVENPMEGTLWENIKKKFIGWLEDNGLWDENGFNWFAFGQLIGSTIHNVVSNAWLKFKEWFKGINWWEDVFKPLGEFIQGLLAGLFPEQYQRWQESKKAAELHNETEGMIREIEGDKNWSENEEAGSPVLRREFNQLQSDIEALINQRNRLTQNSKAVEDETALSEEIRQWALLHNYDEVPTAAELFADYMRGDEHAENAYLDLPLFRAYAIGMEEANRVADKIKELQEVQSDIARRYLGKANIDEGVTIPDIDLGDSINAIVERFGEMVSDALFKDGLESFAYEALGGRYNASLRGYREEAEKALVEYIEGVDWRSGAIASADDIKQTFMDAGIPETYAEAGAKSAEAYLNENRWALKGDLPTSAITDALDKLPFYHRSTAAKAIREYLNEIDFNDPGALSANAILEGIDDANIPNRFKEIAAESISQMLSADWRNAGVTAAKDFTSGFNLESSTPKLRGLVGTDRLVPHFAMGGYPRVGTMFVAGEAGTEFVGNINGRTGVASGQEITGIGDAVWSTGNTTANILTEILEALREKELTITPSSALGKVVARSQKLYQAQMG